MLDRKKKVEREKETQSANVIQNKRTKEKQSLARQKYIKQGRIKQKKKNQSVCKKKILNRKK